MKPPAELAKDLEFLPQIVQRERRLPPSVVEPAGEEEGVVCGSKAMSPDFTRGEIAHLVHHPVARNASLTWRPSPHRPRPLTANTDSACRFCRRARHDRHPHQPAEIRHRRRAVAVGVTGADSRVTVAERIERSIARRSGWRQIAPPRSGNRDVSGSDAIARHMNVLL